MANFEEAWNEYWQSGLSTSCVSNGKDGYPPAIKNFWKAKAFLSLKNNDQIVDLCSGGGGVPKLMIEYSKDKNIALRIAITDLAKISNKLTSPKNVNISYHPKCNCEELPFENESIDFMSSSYGIEYSNLEMTFKEIYRTLKKGSIFSSVLHCYDSEIVTNSNEQLTQGHEILYKLNFFNLFKDIFLARSKSSVIQKSKEKKLLKCLDEIKSRLLLNNELQVFRSILNAAHDVFVFGQSNKPIKCIEYINQMEKSLIYNYQRMNNLAEVVLSKQAIIDLNKYIESLGFKVFYNKKIISNKDKILGLGLICKK